MKWWHLLDKYVLAVALRTKHTFPSIQPVHRDQSAASTQKENAVPKTPSAACKGKTTSGAIRKSSATPLGKKTALGNISLNTPRAAPSSHTKKSLGSGVKPTLSQPPLCEVQNILTQIGTKLIVKSEQPIGKRVECLVSSTRPEVVQPSPCAPINEEPEKARTPDSPEASRQASPQAAKVEDKPADPPGAVEKTKDSDVEKVEDVVTKEIAVGASSASTAEVARDDGGEVAEILRASTTARLEEETPSVVTEKTDNSATTMGETAARKDDEEQMAQQGSSTTSSQAPEQSPAENDQLSTIDDPADVEDKGDKRNSFGTATPRLSAGPEMGKHAARVKLFAVEDVSIAHSVALSVAGSMKEGQSSGAVVSASRKEDGAKDDVDPLFAQPTAAVDEDTCVMPCAEREIGETIVEVAWAEKGEQDEVVAPVSRGGKDTEDGAEAVAMQPTAASADEGLAAEVPLVPPVSEGTDHTEMGAEARAQPAAVLEKEQQDKASIIASVARGVDTGKVAVLPWPHPEAAVEDVSAQEEEHAPTEIVQVAIVDEAAAAIDVHIAEETVGKVGAPSVVEVAPYVTGVDEPVVVVEGGSPAVMAKQEEVPVGNEEQNVVVPFVSMEEGQTNERDAVVVPSPQPTTAVADEAKKNLVAEKAIPIPGKGRASESGTIEPVEEPVAVVKRAEVAALVSERVQGGGEEGNQAVAAKSATDAMDEDSLTVVADTAPVSDGKEGAPKGAAMEEQHADGVIPPSAGEQDAKEVGARSSLVEEADEEIRSLVDGSKYLEFAEARDRVLCTLTGQEVVADYTAILGYLTSGKVQRLMVEGPFVMSVGVFSIFNIFFAMLSRKCLMERFFCALDLRDAEEYQVLSILILKIDLTACTCQD